MSRLPWGKAKSTLGRVRRLRRSDEVQTEQSHPSMGTPVEVPVPRKTRRRVAASTDSLNRPSLGGHRTLKIPSTTTALHHTILGPKPRPSSLRQEVNHATVGQAVPPDSPSLSGWTA